MKSLHSVPFHIDGRMKEICVYCADVTRFDSEIDILTTSAFINSYAPTPATVFRALDEVDINVWLLSQSPAFDLRNPCHVWLSKEVTGSSAQIRRIGCIEFPGDPIRHADPFKAEQSIISSIQAYFHMLDLAAVYDVKMDTVALPLIGSGRQHISGNLLLIPLINECLSFLARNRSVSRICFIERNPEKAALIAQALQSSLRFSKTHEIQITTPEATAFISYSSKDKNIADNLCAKLERNGIKVWYAPRDVQGPYAGAIVSAIDKSQYFIVILSQNSIVSEHVLSEVDLAFQKLPMGMKFKPLKIDNSLFTPSFKYYLSRQHWLDASIPPLESRLNEFVADILSDINHSDNQNSYTQNHTL